LLRLTVCASIPPAIRPLITLLSRALLLSGLVAAVPLKAVYAPVPERDQGKNLTVNVRAGLSHDSNIFGSADNKIDSTVWSLAPRIGYSASVTDQTFVAGAYGLTLDQFKSRPGDKLLDSHDFSLRLAHAFTPATNLDVQDTFNISRNPESLLAGQPVNTDQSLTRNQLDGRFTTPMTQKVGAMLKARSISYRYRDARLGRSLDRTENLVGVAGDYAVLPETKLVAEYRHQEVSYRRDGYVKDKTSNYLMAGADYALARTMSVSGRLGVEWRNRAGERDATAPFAEVSGKYDYSQRSFLAAGYAYTLEETSDTLRFLDSRVHRLFANVQHAVTALTVASASATFEPARLHGRRFQADIDETTWRVGAAYTYLPSKNWSVSAHFDYDRVRSDDRFRSLRRQRVGLNVAYAL